MPPSGVADLAGSVTSFYTCAGAILSPIGRISDRRGPSVSAHFLFRGARWVATMRADEYLRLQAACAAMATQSQTLDVRVRWVKLADAASLAADAASGVARELERAIPVATRARFPNRTPPDRAAARGAKLMITPTGDSSRGESQDHCQKLLRSAPRGSPPPATPSVQPSVPKRHPAVAHKHPGLRLIGSPALLAICAWSLLFRGAACQALSAGRALHSITSSARRRNASGIASPSALAVFRFTISSNFVGCSTGMSPGFAPRRILSR